MVIPLIEWMGKGSRKRIGELDHCSQWLWLVDINSNYWLGSLIDLDPTET